MTLTDAKEVLKRIKANYQSFVNDDYVLKEWYRELKDYDVEDIMNKLEQHMRSEDYGSTLPKLYFLTKYLTKTKDKGKAENYKIQCKFCNEYVSEDMYDKHYERCLDVDYIARVRKTYFDIEISEELKERFKNMEQDLFDSKYLEFLNDIYDKVSSEEQKRIEKIINPQKRKEQEA